MMDLTTADLAPMCKNASGHSYFFHVMHWKKINGSCEMVNHVHIDMKGERVLEGALSGNMIHPNANC